MKQWLCSKMYVGRNRKRCFTINRKMLSVLRWYVKAINNSYKERSKRFIQIICYSIDVRGIRRIVNNFYVQRKCLQTVNKQLKDPADYSIFHSSSGTLGRVLHYTIYRM